MNFLDDAEENSLVAIGKVQHSPVGGQLIRFTKKSQG